MGQVTIVQIPQLNSVVIRQEPGTRFFVSAIDSIVIDKSGYLELLYQLMRIGFVSPDEVYNQVIRKDFEDANKKDDSNSG